MVLGWKLSAFQGRCVGVWHELRFCFVRGLATLSRYNRCILFEGNLSCDSINYLDVFNLWLDL